MGGRYTATGRRMGPEGCLLIWTLSCTENHAWYHDPAQKAQGGESLFPREPGLGSRNTGNAVHVLWDRGTVVGDVGSSAPSQGCSWDQHS